MANSVDQKAVEAIVRRELMAEGYDLSPQRKDGETGADIIARKPRSSIAVESIGFQNNPPSRSKVFYEASFRAVSRLQGEINEIVIALPLRFKDGLQQRATKHGVGWDKIGKTFPELKFWLVDVERNKLLRSSLGVTGEAVPTEKVSCRVDLDKTEAFLYTLRLTPNASRGIVRGSEC